MLHVLRYLLQRLYTKPNNYGHANYTVTIIYLMLLLTIRLTQTHNVRRIYNNSFSYILYA